MKELLREIKDFLYYYFRHYLWCDDCKEQRKIERRNYYNDMLDNNNENPR